MRTPLGDLKILDFTQLLPGPFGTMLLADMGADIIKVENFRSPDMMRFLPPYVDDLSAAYAHINRGKKSLGLDLKTKEAREIIYDLVSEYDIILEQYRPGVMKRLGLDYKNLKKKNNSIIYCSLTGYGQTGSYANRAGHDINYIALSGVESYSGRRKSGPVPGGIQIADISGGSAQLVIAVLAAYIKRLKYGEGDYIDLSMTDFVFTMSVMQTAGFLVDGRVPALETELLNGGLIYDFYRTLDGRYLSIGPLETKFFTNFCKKIGLTGYDNIFSIPFEKLDEVKAEVSKIISSKTMDEWILEFRDTDSCVEPVYNIKETINNPPISERDLIINVRNSNGKDIPQIANPIRFKSGKYCSKYSGAGLGYHNKEIMKFLGYSKDRIQGLYDNGVIGN